MTRKRSERSRWATIFTINSPAAISDPHERAAFALAKHEQLAAVVSAFDKVGRAVRIEPGRYGSSLDIKARRS